MVRLAFPSPSTLTETVLQRSRPPASSILAGERLGEAAGVAARCSRSNCRCSRRARARIQGQSASTDLLRRERRAHLLEIAPRNRSRKQIGVECRAHEPARLWLREAGSLPRTDLSATRAAGLVRESGYGPFARWLLGWLFAPVQFPPESIRTAAGASAAGGDAGLRAARVVALAAPLLQLRVFEIGPADRARLDGFGLPDLRAVRPLVSGRQADPGAPNNSGAGGAVKNPAALDKHAAAVAGRSDRATLVFLRSPRSRQRGGDISRYHFRRSPICRPSCSRAAGGSCWCR